MIACDGRIVPNFSLSEMANNKAGDAVKLVLTPDMVQFAFMVQEFRDWYRLPMTVNSWYRTKSFNAACGGSANSAHLRGTALDWGIKGHTDRQRSNVAAKWKQICAEHNVFGKINFYTNGYHLEAFSDKAYGATVNWRVLDYRERKGDW